ncbi:MAG: CDP-diacylglycerol--glycerol-3-phosphate 3-phosphatidyltransferase [Proteobacteria bacterium]|nr:CDP-diacylglycerol--glycerol-3-phosphate 3-phosphatidyltransferase [Pseudomonadota bacterium]
MITSLPNLLSLSRIAAIPVLLGLFFLDGELARWVAGAIFFVACLTDFLDGYFARVRRQQTDLGRLLDPIADKLLVAATIFMLVAFDRVTGLAILPAMVILCREIVVSGLREFLAGLSISMPVTRLTKWKTAIQMAAIGVLLIGDAGPVFIPMVEIGEVGLWIAAALTFITGYNYLRASAKHLTGAGVAPKSRAVKEAKPANPLG